MIFLLNRDYDKENYIFLESFDCAESVSRIKLDYGTEIIIKKIGYRYFFVSDIDITKNQIKNKFDDHRGTHVVYLDDTRISDFRGEALKAWSDYRDSKLNNILNKESTV